MENNVSQKVNLYKSNYRKKKPKLAAVLAAPLAVAMLFFGGVSPASAADTATVRVDLGTAGNYSVLAGTTITQNGTSVLSQDIGISPGISTRLLGGVIDSLITPTAATAQADLNLAFYDADSRPATAIINAQLGGQVLSEGVYESNTGDFLLDGVLTLDGQNDPNSVFIIKADNLTTAAGSQIRLINGAQPCNVFIQVDGSANLGSNSVFVGTLLALNSITANVGATVEGRLLADEGTVSLNANLFAAPGCDTAFVTTAGNFPLAVTTPDDSVLSAGSVRGFADEFAAGVPAEDVTPVVEPEPAVVPAPVAPPAVTPNSSSTGTDTSRDFALANTGTVVKSNGVSASAAKPAAITANSLARTGAEKWLSSLAIAGLGLLIVGIGFLFYKRHPFLEGFKLHRQVK